MRATQRCTDCHQKRLVTFRGPYPTFWPYFANNAGFLVLTCFRDGKIAYLNARPALRRTKIEERGVPIVIPTRKICPPLSKNQDVERLEQALHR